MKYKRFYNHNYQRGAFGEALCSHILQIRGYKVIKRNYKVNGGEVDIICSKGLYLVFVEVKTWAYFTESSIMYSVDKFKLSRLRACADCYIQSSDVKFYLHTRMCVRFDLMFFNINNQTIIHYKGVE